MSTQNIIDMQQVGAGVAVRFRVHGKEGQRTYLYESPSEAAAILGGADTAQFSGFQVDRIPSSGPGGIGTEIGSEIGAVGGAIGGPIGEVLGAVVGAVGLPKVVEGAVDVAEGAAALAVEAVNRIKNRNNK